jgi:hypothetical protein
MKFTVGFADRWGDSNDRNHVGLELDPVLLNPVSRNDRYESVSGLLSP